MWLLHITLHNVLVWRTNFHRFGITAYDDIWLLHIVCFGNTVCLVSAEITFDFVVFRCTHFKGAIKHLLNSEPNQIFWDVVRGEQKISASIPVRLIPTTVMSPMARLCRSTTKLQRREMCLLRLRNLFSFDNATAAWQSSYMIVGFVWRNPSSIHILRK